MIKLYGGGPSRWVKPYWLLGELDVKFEPIVTFSNPTAQAELAELNVYKKVPVLVDRDFVLNESTAIVNYLAEKYPEKKMIPKSGTQDRARYDRWTSFVVGDLEQPLWRIARHRHLYGDNDRSEADIELAKRDFRKIAEVLDKEIADAHLVGDAFSAADVTMTYTLAWAQMDSLLSGFDKLLAYHDRHIERPAFPRHLYDRS